MFVIYNTQQKLYVACSYACKPFTSSVQNARAFRTRADAERLACLNEEVRAVADCEKREPET